MNWWKAALFDTCSLITLDKALLERADLATHFPSSILALEESFSVDQLRAETSRRMRPRVTPCPLPTPVDLAGILDSTIVPQSLSTVDKLVYAAAVHYQIAVVTADKQLARAVKAKDIHVGNVALILRELVHAKSLTVKDCEEVLLGLAYRKDFIVGGRATPHWTDLQDYTFPD
ncbi:MAG TPA: hypothetical protein DD670_10625 [Planctomycetaceae bacterium]|nr:hypothetical protein [Planctomycetaceae bacterium]